MKSAATVEQVVEPGPTCAYCGPLSAHMRDDKYLHKCACPHRADSYCQAHPQGCDDFTDIRTEAGRKSYQIMGPL